MRNYEFATWNLYAKKIVLSEKSLEGYKHPDSLVLRGQMEFFYNGYFCEKKDLVSTNNLDIIQLVFSEMININPSYRSSVLDISSDDWKLKASRDCMYLELCRIENAFFAHLKKLGIEANKENLAKFFAEIDENRIHHLNSDCYSFAMKFFCIRKETNEEKEKRLKFIAKEKIKAEKEKAEAKIKEDNEKERKQQNKKKKLQILAKQLNAVVTFSDVEDNELEDLDVHFIRNKH